MLYPIELGVRLDFLLRNGILAESIGARNETVGCGIGPVAVDSGCLGRG